MEKYTLRSRINLKAKKIMGIFMIFLKKRGLQLFFKFMDGYLIKTSNNHTIKINKEKNNDK